jgi:hypothetical protein
MTLKRVSDLLQLMAPIDDALYMCHQLLELHIRKAALLADAAVYP